MMRIIGDIHGHFDWYVDTVKKANAEGIRTFQVGDFGIGMPRMKENFDWHDYWREDPDNLADMNRVLVGNHDSPLSAKSCPLIVSRFGSDVQFCKDKPSKRVFWAGGAYSIDWAGREEYYNWWPNNEELTYSEMREAEELYRQWQPKVVITHDGPRSAIESCFDWEVANDAIQNVSRTQQFLDHLLTIHRPKLWLFGHWHRNETRVIDGTTFRCVATKDFVDIDEREGIILP